MNIYAERIDAAKSLEELENIIEEAADDDWITNEEYCRVYDYCVNRVLKIGKEATA